MHPRTEAVLNDVSSQNQISEDHHYAHQSKAKSNASTKGGHNRIFHLSVNRMDIGTMKAQMILSSKKLPSLSRQIALEFQECFGHSFIILLQALFFLLSGGPCPYAMISDYEAHKLFLMFDLLQTNGQTRKSIYLLQVDLICPGSSLRHKTLIEKGIKRPQQQRRPFMICWTL